MSLNKKISLYSIGLMLIIPFLLPLHKFPITTFYQEICAVALGVFAMGIMWVESGDIEIPQIVIFPMALILIALVQYLLGKIELFEQSELYCSYFVWAAALMVLGRNLSKKVGFDVLVSYLSIFLVVGAELNAVIGLIQHLCIHTPFDSLIVKKISSAIYGNIAQPNHYADYMALGLISIITICTNGKLKTWVGIILAVPVLSMMLLSGSRSSILYLILITGAWLYYFGKEYGAKQYRKIVTFSIIAIATFLILSSSDQVTPFQRLLGNGDYIHIRLYLWSESLAMFSQYPIWGVGLGQFSFHHNLLAPIYQDTHITGLYNNAHNLIFMIAAETGIAGLALLIVPVTLWINRQSVKTANHWWGLMILAILGIHSLLEYPIWYAYFLGIAAFLLGAMDSKTFKIKYSDIQWGALLALWLIAVAVIINTLISYVSLESAFVSIQAARSDASYIPVINTQIENAKKSDLLHPYIKFYEAQAFDRPNYTISQNEQAMHFMPSDYLVYKEVQLLIEQGRIDDAKDQLERSLWAFPYQFPIAIDYLQRLTAQDAKFNDILQFALKIQSDRNAKVKEDHHVR